MSDLESESADFFRELLRFRSDRFDPLGGVRGAVLILAPFALGIAFGWGLAGVVATLGALNLVLVTLPPPTTTPTRRLVIAASANALAFGAGTALVLVPPAIEIPLAGIGVFVGLSLSRDPRLEQVGITAAIMYVVAIGLPVSGPIVVPYRAVFLLAGGLWAVAGWFLLSRWGRGYEVAKWGPPVEATTTAPMGWTDLLAHAGVVGATVAFGLALGGALHLERDPWIMLTVIVALRFDLRTTLAYSVARIAGTIGGAGLAFFVTETIVDPLVLLGILAVATFLMYGSRTVNYTFYAVWLTLVVIILLNLVSSGGPTLAVTRIVDTLIGGGVALAASVLISLFPVRAPHRASGRGAGGASR